MIQHARPSCPVQKYLTLFAIFFIVYNKVSQLSQYLILIRYQTPIFNIRLTPIVILFMLLGRTLELRPTPIEYLLYVLLQY